MIRLIYRPPTSIDSTHFTCHVPYCMTEPFLIPFPSEVPLRAIFYFYSFFGLMTVDVRQNE